MLIYLILVAPDMMTEKSFYPNFGGSRGVSDFEGASGKVLGGEGICSALGAILGDIGNKD